MNSPIEILKLLDKSNCQACGYTTCLAFASAVFKGQKSLAECPHLERDVVAELENESEGSNAVDPSLEEPLEELKKGLKTIDTKGFTLK